MQPPLGIEEPPVLCNKLKAAYLGLAELVELCTTELRRNPNLMHTRVLLHARRALDGVLGACVRQHASSTPLTRNAKVIETPPSPSLRFDSQY